MRMFLGYVLWGLCVLSVVIAVNVPERKMMAWLRGMADMIKEAREWLNT